MLKYSLRRILGMIPMLLLISIVVFTLAKLMPGDSFSGEIDPTNTDPQYIEQMREKLGYNDPVYVQYFRWISDFVQGDFGKSTRYKMDVSDVIGERIPNTIFLSATSLIITYLFAFFMGSYAGRKPYTLGDNLIGGVNYLGLSIPSFVAAVFAIYFFSFQLNIFPSNGSVDITVTEGTFEYWLSKIHHVILPALILGLLSTASYTQFLRNDIIENSRKDFVRTARAKGTKESKIYNVHILRNSIIPLVTFLGFDIVSLVGGAIITETIFTYPGIGQLFIDSIRNNDYPIIMTLTMMFSFLTLFGNLIADILYGVVDPRIRLD
ncbi:MULTISPECIES: oligopeptide ABC transporter permease [Heyndrickxia]|jgi:peptide/nickel transport system permease protein|uniref:ABC transporter permease n=1 Tax=Heyndrickxia oleronia TaxID=38875 RepID=A0AAW6T1L7_9BACI|nr:oligopeptide ABC transporter permease [Heyndrickxia oleronia]MBU5211774.1 ABC transporter permease [Heyndrickxia oleronia]MCI1590465.1 ABC transporter permease [Heyndrickxia oleronia]MCI1611274.1 ABC transporter permease [Heyndrickxia oleronia]MCI1742716.1 ABC transporter permease [Heyndrickxia oleronia]MCI1762556.1 ABC transporter permease [Heyndrickxia oleronia]